MPGNYQLKSSDGKFYFDLVTSDCALVLTSKLHSTRPGALLGIELAREHSRGVCTYDRKESGASGLYFVLRQATGEVIGMSEAFASQEGLDCGIEACKELGPSAELVDLT